jgi:hypothetical protein
MLLQESSKMRIKTLLTTTFMATKILKKCLTHNEKVNLSSLTSSSGISYISFTAVIFKLHAFRKQLSMMSISAIENKDKELIQQEVDMSWTIEK